MTQKTPHTTLKASQKIQRCITWTQVSLEASERLRGLIGREPKAAQLVLALIERMEPGSGGVVIASRTTMAEIIGASLPTVARALKVLMDEGWVQRMRIGSAPALAINSRVAWTGQRGHLSHAVFSATVIASRSEQDEHALNPPPMQSIAFAEAGKWPVATGPGEPPPSQPDLPEMPPAVAWQSQSIDPETGEIL